jgi:hypothetical protein
LRLPGVSGALLGAALALWVAAGCGAAPPSPIPSNAVSSGEPVSPAATTDASRPPAAVLSVNGQGRREGELGTYVYRGAGSDSPWLPARSLESVAVPAGARLGVRLADRRLIGAWSARVAAAADEQGVPTRPLADEPDASRRWAALEFTAPGPGSWVLEVSLDYGDGSGSGAYFWLIEVR